MHAARCAPKCRSASPSGERTGSMRGCWHPLIGLSRDQAGVALGHGSRCIAPVRRALGGSGVHPVRRQRVRRRWLRAVGESSRHRSSRARERRGRWAALARQAVERPAAGANGGVSDCHGSGRGAGLDLRVTAVTVTAQTCRSRPPCRGGLLNVEPLGAPSPEKVSR